MQFLVWRRSRSLELVTFLYGVREFYRILMLEEGKKVELHRSDTTVIWKVIDESQSSVLKLRRATNESDLEAQMLHMRVCSAVLSPSLLPLSHIEPLRTREGLFVQCFQPFYSCTYEEMLRNQGKIEEEQARNMLLPLCEAMTLANRYVIYTIEPAPRGYYPYVAVLDGYRGGFRPVCAI